MNTFTRFFVALLAIGIPTAAFADNPLKCWAGKGSETQKLNGFVLNVRPVASKIVDPEDASCRATVTSPTGATIFSTTDFAFGISRETGRPISNEHAPDAVFEAWSGGAPCCLTYWIVSLGKNPGLAARIPATRYNVSFKDLAHNGQTEILTRDGAFGAFDDLCDACSPAPLVILRLKGRKLRFVGAEFWSLYQADISAARKEITATERSQFRNQDKTMDYATLERAKEAVLQTVLSFLYADRDSQAWKALNEMWPPSDRARIQAEILKTLPYGFPANPGNPGFAPEQ